MLALRVTDFTEPPALQDVPTPAPSAGEVLVKIGACALNFADLLMLNGTYQATPPLPFSPGLELAGTIVAHGADTDQNRLPIGTRVAIFAGQGGLAEYGCFPANTCTPLPDNMHMDTAAAFQVAFGTSHVALTYKAKLMPGETLVVLGASGGVGLTAVEIGKLMGAKVIAVARGADKLAVAASKGADHLIDSETADIKAEIRALGGADVIYDPVGGGQFEAALRACNPDGRVLVIGFASGEIPKPAANILMVKNITVIGFYWGGYLGFRPNVVTDSLKQLFEWHGKGHIAPHISARFPVAQAAEALAFLHARKSTGKVVVTME